MRWTGHVALQQAALRLQTISADLWTFPINLPSPLRIHFPLLNSAELHHYRVTCIIYCLGFNSSSSLLSLAFVMYTFGARPVAGRSLLAMAELLTAL
jgi:AraC-like DNA-binding protein